MRTPRTRASGPIALTTLVALAALATSACNKKSEASTNKESAPIVTDTPAGSDGSYDLTTSAADCTAGSICTATLRIEARGEYHINEQYPYKFTASPASGIALLGTDPGGTNVFTKAAGDFVAQGPKVGVMTIKLKPASQGNVTIDGVFKLSVCSDATCKLDNPAAKVTLAVK